MVNENDLYDFKGRFGEDESIVFVYKKAGPDSFIVLVYPVKDNRWYFNRYGTSMFIGDKWRREKIDDESFYLYKWDMIKALFLKKIIQ